jgi:hypothetical protein
MLSRSTRCIHECKLINYSGTLSSEDFPIAARCRLQTRDTQPHVLTRHVLLHHTLCSHLLACIRHGLLSLLRLILLGLFHLRVIVIGFITGAAIVSDWHFHLAAIAMLRPKVRPTISLLWLNRRIGTTA